MKALQFRGTHRFAQSQLPTGVFRSTDDIGMLILVIIRPMCRVRACMLPGMAPRPLFSSADCPRLLLVRPQQS